mmetsp:Transcript_21425/g.29825  ORF Transcript_21425/g.29825 Transcript_21425/m.29825 type:complete len:288 (+) Transcript_21425:46-909(+)
MTLAEEYYQAESRPADVVHDFRNNKDVNAGDDFLFGENGNSLAFVIPNIFTEQECDEVIQLGEDAGYIAPQKELGTLRTAKRTSNYSNQDLANRVTDTIGSILETKLPTLQDDLGEFYGLHQNWRLVRYDPVGDSFCAHQDQMDSFQKKYSDGTKDFIVSTHTLLINLSKDGVVGGATRFYPKSKVKTAKPGQYDYAVDVILPRGWGIAFRQKGLIHSGQPVLPEGDVAKHVAQTGILRTLPKTKLCQPSVFSLGPGLAEAAEKKYFEKSEAIKNHVDKKYAISSQA